MSAEPYERLARLAERELELAGEGRFDELTEIERIRAEILDELPDTPPPSAHAALQRAALTQERVMIELMRGRDQVLFALRNLAALHRAAGGYRRSLGLRPPHGRFDASA